jgi:DNA-binding transcriptional regulator YbjK
MTTEPRRKARHDPAGRRRAIVAAAADLLVASGFAELTHRRVAERAGVPLGATTYYFDSLADLEEAALGVLAEKLESEIAGIGWMLASAHTEPRAVTGHLAAGLHAYLNDREQVRADAALYIAATRRASLRPLALRWFEGFTKLLAKYTDERTALAIAIFSDGAGVHSMLHDEPVDADFLADMITRLTAGSWR